MTIHLPMFPPPLAAPTHVHSRRAMLGGVVTVAALVAVPAALARTSDDVQLNELLRRWKAASKNLRATEAAQAAANAQLPWWAKSGPEYLCHDGTFAGRENGWPAIEDMERPPSPSMFRKIRPSPYSLKHDYEQSILIFGPSAIPSARKRRHAALRALVERKRRQSVEKEKVCLPALDKQIDEAYELREDLADAIRDLPPSFMSVAAVIITSLGGGWDGEVTADRVLEHLAPALAGEIADDVRKHLATA